MTGSTGLFCISFVLCGAVYGKFFELCIIHFSTKFSQGIAFFLGGWYIGAVDIDYHELDHAKLCIVGYLLGIVYLIIFQM